MSHVIEEVAGVLGITLKHATTKYARTIGVLEQSHSSIKQALKIETGERRSLWHKYINIAVLNYNTSCHTSIPVTQVSQADSFTAEFLTLYWI